MKLLKLVFEAPLQSWGERSRWDSRDTSTMPTKSAVIGMLGCCLGIPRGDKALEELCSQLKMAVRADRPGRIMSDFHTVQGTDGVLMNAAGDKRSGGSTIITPKQYLQEAKFTVWLWGDEQALAKCADALRHPQWTTFLGRRSCVPTKPLLPRWIEAENVSQVVRMGSSNEKYSDYMSIEIEYTNGDEIQDRARLLTRNDGVVRADLNDYSTRQVLAYSIRKEEMEIVLE